MVEKFNIGIVETINEEKKEVSFNFPIEINGVIVNGGHLTDLYEILGVAIGRNRDYAYFWNCDCGEPGCAGIESCNIKKVKDTEEYFIIIPNPCSINDFKEKSHDYWEENHKKVVLKITRQEIAKKLWDISFKIEERVLVLTKKYRLCDWPTTSRDYGYSWPTNLPVHIREKIRKHELL